MARIVLLDGQGLQLRLDADGADDCVGYRNLLPGFHELRVGGADRDWIGAALVVRAGDTALLRVAKDHLEPAPDAAAPSDEQLIDAMARDPRRARAWQAATSALDARAVRETPAPPTAPSPPAGLRELQAAFVRAWLHGDGDARATLAAVARAWADAGSEGVQLAPDAAARIGRALAGMVTLFPSLAPDLPVDNLVGALSDAGNDLADGDLLAAANQLQLLTRE
jgi:hypothetical protein